MNKNNKPVVKQSLTTESKVNYNSTPEEKAREYASKSVQDYIVVEAMYKSFLDVYHSRDKEVKELRESVKELIEQIYKCPLDLSSDEKVEEATYLDATIKQAKQLLE